MFDIYLGDGGIILGFDTDLDGRIDTVTAPTLTVPSAVFGVSPLKVQLTILSFGGNGGAGARRLGRGLGCGAGLCRTLGGRILGRVVLARVVLGRVVLGRVVLGRVVLVAL